MIELRFSSDDEEECHQKHKLRGVETQEDSAETLKSKEITAAKIEVLIKQLRRDAKAYLSVRDSSNADNISIHKIWSKLRKNERYLRKREGKGIDKGMVD